MILCLMQFPPLRNGHGGSQRAWYLLHALAALAPVHLVLLTNSREPLFAADIGSALPNVRTVTNITIPEWTPSWHINRRLPRRLGRWIDVARMRSVYAPHFSPGVIARVAAQLPARQADIVFAGRLPAACLVDAMIRQGLLSADVKVVDFDDIQSHLQEREGRAEGNWRAPDKALMNRLQLFTIKAAETRIGSRWHAVSVCSDDDTTLLAEKLPGARIFRIPNVIDKPLLPPATDGPFTILFVGNLAFGPNRQGLDLYVKHAWPRIRAARPDIRMRVVGLNPPDALRAALQAADIDLFENVPSVEPYYADASVVIAPILFGSGTRIKILEAMAFGRAVVATTMGAEGLDVQPGRHALIADDMDAFATAILTLADKPDLRSSLETEARALQQERYSPPAMERAVRAMVTARHSGPQHGRPGELSEAAEPPA